jgi:hypothetical protein
MLQRRRFVATGIAAVVAGVAPVVRAQRATQPIARPPGQRLVAGRFDPDGGIATGAYPGIYVVVSVDTMANTLQLRDEGGRTGLVHVNDDIFDLEAIKAGDEVQVDFKVPDPGSNRLEAGGLWKVQP